MNQEEAISKAKSPTDIAKVGRLGELKRKREVSSHNRQNTTQFAN
jgi:hypothetical protein